MAARFSNSLVPTTLAGLLSLASPIHALTRYIGSPSDSLTQAIALQCGASDQSNFKVGRCPGLLRCVLDNLPSDLAAGMNSGSNIASLVPTIAALIGAPPMDLVQMALLSPHRALATCCFSIGLPSGLFRQLKPVLPRLGDRIGGEPRVREWVLQLPASAETGWMYGRRMIAIKVATDVVMLGLVAVMLWFTFRITTETMVTWRCEYGILLFLWPLACVVWLIIAMILLWAFKKKLEIIPINAPSTRATSLTMWQLVMLPYSLKPIKDQDAPGLPTQDPRGGGNEKTGDSAHGVAHSSGDSSPPRNPKIDGTMSSHIPASTVTNQKTTIHIRITMHDDLGIRSWRWYEAFIETLAVGIYLYATFVLTSSLFMSGEMGLSYACVIILCLSAVRILGSVS